MPWDAQAFKMKNFVHLEEIPLKGGVIAFKLVFKLLEKKKGIIEFLFKW
jgi:hypothetical protein